MIADRESDKRIYFIYRYNYEEVWLTGQGHVLMEALHYFPLYNQIKKSHTSTFTLPNQHLYVYSLVCNLYKYHHSEESMRVKHYEYCFFSNHE